MPDLSSMNHFFNNYGSINNTLSVNLAKNKSLQIAHKQVTKKCESDIKRIKRNIFCTHAEIEKRLTQEVVVTKFHITHRLYKTVNKKPIVLALKQLYFSKAIQKLFPLHALLCRRGAFVQPDYIFTPHSKFLSYSRLFLQLTGHDGSWCEALSKPAQYSTNDNKVSALKSPFPSPSLF